MRSSLTAIATALLSAAVIQLAAQPTEGDRKQFEAIKAAADGGEALSQFAMGFAYAHALGVEKDEKEAVKWFRKAAEQNYAEAQNELGLCYRKGRGVANDEEGAMKWFLKAAEQNHAAAQYNVGVGYDEGWGVAEDKVKAAKWYRKAAEQNHAAAQYDLGVCYGKGRGVAKDEKEAMKWFLKAAEQNFGEAQINVGIGYVHGRGVAKDNVKAAKWFRKAAEQNYAEAQYSVGIGYAHGSGVAKDEVEAAKWIRKAAEQNYAQAQLELFSYYYFGAGVVKNYVEAYKWLLLAAGQDYKGAKELMPLFEDKLTREQIAEGQAKARNFKPRKVPSVRSDSSSATVVESRPESSGSGFFITEDGYLITNEHVVGGGGQVRLLTAAGIISAKVVKVDAANDLALLKTEGHVAALPVVTSRSIKLGGTVATVGFPNVDLQGFAPKFARGEIGSLSGPQDDARYFQISVPVQPGNSGGALVDERGNVVGVVSAKLSAKEALLRSGALPENVNYAVKSSFLLGFLESMPEVAAKLKEPNVKDMKFADVVEQTKEAAALVLVY